MIKNKCLLMFCLLVTVFSFSVTKLQAARLHAFLIADTISGEDEIVENLDSMQREVKRIAAFTDLKLNAFLFEGEQVRIENVIQQLDDLKIKPNDVVLLYFSMHGSRTLQKKNCWPDLIFTIDRSCYGEMGYLDMNKLNERVINKHPRLLIAIADSCNTYRIIDNKFLGEDFLTSENINEKNQAFLLPTPAFHQIKLGKNERAELKMTQDNRCLKFYRTLFLKSKGSIITSAAKPGYIAIQEPATGGVYTIQFIKALQDLTGFSNRHTHNLGKESLSWKIVLDLASMQTQDQLIQNDYKGAGAPQFEISY